MALSSFDPFSLHKLGVFPDAIHGAIFAAVARAVVTARRPVPADVLRVRRPQSADPAPTTDPAGFLVANQPRGVVDDLATAPLLERLELIPRHVMNAVHGTRVNGLLNDLFIVALQ